MLPIETTTKLLKLHLQWSDRKRYDGKEDQPLEFYKWLFVNHHDRPEVIAIDDLTMIEDFLNANNHVLWPSQKEEEEKWANLRLEPRFTNGTEIEMTVLEGKTTDQIGSVFKGETLDIGLHGLRATVSEKIDQGTIVTLRIEGGAHSYQLIAEIRWATELDDGYLIGLLLNEDDDFSKWQANFGTDVVAPSLSATRSSKKLPGVP